MTKLDFFVIWSLSISVFVFSVLFVFCKCMCSLINFWKWIRICILCKISWLVVFLVIYPVNSPIYCTCNWIYDVTPRLKEDLKLGGKGVKLTSENVESREIFKPCCCLCNNNNNNNFINLLKKAFQLNLQCQISKT